MKFSHLHNHTEYSLLDGLSKIEDLLNEVKRKGMDSVAITDHGNIYGAVEFYKKAKEKGIKPIIGCEMYLAYEKLTDKRPKIDDKRYHLVLLVKNETGYKNLVKLITKAHLEGFYYKPRIDEETLRQYSEGLIGLSACIAGKIPQLILSDKKEEAEKQILIYQEIFGKDNFYLELQHHAKVPEQKKVNDGLIYLAKKLKVPLVATNDCHYLNPEDADAQDILTLINTGSDPNNPERMTMKMDDFSLKSPEQMIKEFETMPEAIENTQKIVEMCEFEFELGKIKLPKYETPDKLSPEEYLRKLCEQGLKKKYGDNVSKEIRERLEYELETIKQTGFASYFLIVQDFVNWAKSKRIVVGPGRGSVGGSFVAYILNITSIDPIKYNLLFERFLNPERISMPDIDLDFTDRRRDEVIKYVREKYGENHVAQIITFGRMNARAVIRDVGRVLQYPYSYCDKIAKLIPQGLTLEQALARVEEFRELFLNDSQAQRMIEYAKKLEKTARHASTHACGVVISDRALDDIVPLQHPTQDDDNIVTQFEMHAIEDIGLLKMDFLGLKNLTIIEETLAKIYAIHKKSIDIENLPMDDEKTFHLFQKAETIGVFQLESDGMRKYLKQLKPTNIEDIIAMVALYRPGPMQFISDYINGKLKKKKIEYLHPKLKPILESTYGICLYQEQIMKIVRELAGFTLGEADILRKAIGKKIKDLLLKQKSKFIIGCKKNEIDEFVAQKIWNWIEPFANYSFNRSHATAYAIIAYQTAYLKAHYPVEFMASLLTSDQADIEKIGFLIEECKRMKIKVLPPDINESWRNFSVVPFKNQIRFGLLGIKNVGENITEAIIKERKSNGHFKSMEDFLFRIKDKDLNKKSLESMIKVGVFDNFDERNHLLLNVERLLEYNRELKKNANNHQRMLFENTMRNESKIILEKTKPATKNEKLNWEKELLGLFISSNPLESYKKILEQKTFPIFKITPAMARLNKTLKIGGIISKIKKIITKNGENMLFMELNDMNGKIEVIVFPKVIYRNPNAFHENKVVFVTGKISNKDEMPKIICENVEEIVEL